MEELTKVLQNTLSNNNEERKNAEQILFQYSQQPAYTTHLFNIINMENLDNADFPDVWPELVDNLAAAMKKHAGDSDRLFSCLTIIDDLCMKYRHELKSIQLWLEIKLVLDKNTNFTKMISIYHSLLSQDLPEVAVNVQKMGQDLWKAFNATKDTKGCDEFHQSGILFIATLAVRPHYQNFFLGEAVFHIEKLFEKLIAPNISYSDEDRDLLEDDPVAFFKHDLDGFDKETVRGAAVELLRALSSRFEEKVVTIITPLIDSEVDKYRTNPAAYWR
uniref:Exportin-2 central domain-containing protein n=1 Tax=Panagrolaimus sp. ES5 TaxID=591445 RepID=A0AC34FDW2_9BILA